MRAICTGISGVNKRDYLADLGYTAMRERKIKLDVLDVGTFVEKEAERLFQQSHIAISPSGIDRKVLDLPRSTLRQLRATAWEQILRGLTDQGNFIVSMHACFRWKKALTLVVDAMYLDKYKPDLFITLKDKPNRIRDALERDPKWRGKLSEHEVAAWQQEEIEATRILAGYRQKDWKVFSTEEPKEKVINFLFNEERRLPYTPEPVSNHYISVYCTAISGTKVRQYLRTFCSWAREVKSREIRLLDLAERIIEEAKKDNPTITRNNILKEKNSELDKWRTKALASIRDEQRASGDCIILGHSCFRLNFGEEELLLAFDPDQELFKWCQLNPDVYVTFTDNILANKIRLNEEEHTERLTLSLREIAMWHDEERFFTRLIAENFGKPHYIIPIAEPFETLYRIAFERGHKRAYLSFPITEVLKKPKEDVEEIFKNKNDLKEALRKSYVIFDPLDIQDGALSKLLNFDTNFPYRLDKHLIIFKESDGNIPMELKSLQILKDSQDTFKVEGHDVELTRSELEEVKDHVADQIVERDYYLIDQSNWVIVYYPVSDVSPGVISEVIYGFSHGRDVFAWWFSGGVSPFLEAYLTEGHVSDTKDTLLNMLARYSM